MTQFRWVAIITLWTILAGPIFHASGPTRSPRAPAAVQQMVPHVKPVEP